MAGHERSTDYPIADQLSVGVYPVEDRLVLLAATRNADLLEGTSEQATQAAPGVRDEVLQLEHVSALAAGQADTGAAGEGAAPAPNAAYLVTEAHFRTREQVLVLALDGVRRRADGPDGAHKESVFALALDRTNAHKVLRMLTDKAGEAGWDLPKPSAWTQKIKQAKAGSVN